MFFNDLELIPGTLRNPPDLPEVSHLLQFGTSSTRAGGQDDVSSNQLPQINTGTSNGRFAVDREFIYIYIYIFIYHYIYMYICII